MFKDIRLLALDGIVRPPYLNSPEVAKPVISPTSNFLAFPTDVPYFKAFDSTGLKTVYRGYDVLISDKNNFVMDHVGHSMRGSDYEVKTFGDNSELLHKYMWDKQNTGLILLSLDAPSMDPKKLIELVRESEKKSGYDTFGVPIVALSNDAVKNTSDLEEIGFNALCVKSKDSGTGKKFTDKVIGQDMMYKIIKHYSKFN